MGTFGVVVLAAGGSTRMGRAKQLLPYGSGSLVEHAVRIATNSGASEVVVVVGAEAGAVGAAIRHLGVKIVENDRWEEGMGGSVAAGVAALESQTERVVIALADQPGVTTEHLQSLGSSLAPITASLYEGVVGVPCAFAREKFPLLRALRGDQGARDLLRSAGEAVETVAFEAARRDVDTPEDFQRLSAELEEGTST